MKENFINDSGYYPYGEYNYAKVSKEYIEQENYDKSFFEVLDYLKDDKEKVKEFLENLAFVERISKDDLQTDEHKDNFFIRKDLVDSFKKEKEKKYSKTDKSTYKISSLSLDKDVFEENYKDFQKGDFSKLEIYKREIDYSDSNREDYNKNSILSIEKSGIVGVKELSKTKRFMFQKDELIEALENEIKKIDEQSEYDIEAHEVCNSVINTVLDENLIDFKNVALLSVKEKLEDKISKMKIDETISVRELRKEFMPKEVETPFFNTNEEDQIVLLDLRKRVTSFVNEITPEALQVFSELMETTPPKTMKEKENLEFKAFMEVGLEYSLYNDLEVAIDDLKYYTQNEKKEFDWDNLTRADLKIISNSLENGQLYTEKEILKDIKGFEKDKNEISEIEY
jgi:hypothetical protein